MTLRDKISNGFHNTESTVVTWDENLDNYFEKDIRILSLARCERSKIYYFIS